MSMYGCAPIAMGSDARPDDLDDPERPRFREKAVDAGQNAADGEGEHKVASSTLKRVHDHHERDSADAIDRDEHRLNLPTHTIFASSARRVCIAW
jgi:hypothetical protein